MAKDQAATASMSAESVGFLEDVKKGKARKFAMICKGTEVVSVVVYKKGSVEAQKKEAKQAGKGQFYFGVVEGQGQDVRFVLARSDGFESAPVKNTALKGFLEEAGVKCKPTFEIVDTAPLVLDLDDPLVIRYMKLKEEAGLSGQSFPDYAGELNQLCQQAGQLLDQSLSEEASAKLDTLEKLLGSFSPSVSTSSPPPPPAPPPPPPMPNNAGLESKLLEALKKLQPLLAKASELHPGRSAELQATYAQIEGEIRQQQYAVAQPNLVTYGKLLQSLIPKPVTPVPTENSNDVLERLKAMAPRIKLALTGPEAARVQELVTMTKDLVGKKEYSNAAQVLSVLESMLNSLNVPGGPGVSLVKLGRARVEWDQVRQHAIRELARLKKILDEEYQGIEEERAALASSHQRLDSMIATMNEELGNKLDLVLNADPEQRPNLAAAAKDVLKRFVEFLNSNDVMAVIDANEFATDMIVAEPMRDKLNEITLALG